jgi:hypothetical protein
MRKTGRTGIKKAIVVLVLPAITLKNNVSSGRRTRNTKPTTGTNAAAKTKKEMINNILEKGLLGIRTVKVFKAYNLPQDTADKKTSRPFPDNEKGRQIHIGNRFISLQR